MQTCRDLAIEIILFISGLIDIIFCSVGFNKWLLLSIGILELLFSVSLTIFYFIDKNKKK